MQFADTASARNAALVEFGQPQETESATIARDCAVKFLRAAVVLAPVAIETDDFRFAQGRRRFEHLDWDTPNAHDGTRAIRAARPNRTDHAVATAVAWQDGRAPGAPHRYVGALRYRALVRAHPPAPGRVLTGNPRPGGGRPGQPVIAKTAKYTELRVAFGKSSRFNTGQLECAAPINGTFPFARPTERNAPVAGVSLTAIVIYPKELTDKDWQKKKGLLAKTKKTGLGPELLKGEALHKKIDSALLDPANNNPQSTAALKDAVVKAKSYYTANVVPLQKQLAVIEKVAKQAEQSLKKTPGAGSGAKAAAEVAKAASNFAVTCKSLDMEARVKEAADRIKRINELAATHLSGSITKFAQGAKAYLSNPSKESWETNIKQQGRSVSNSVKQLDAYNKAFWTTFEKFKGFDLVTLGLQGDDPATEEKRVRLVKLAAQQVGAIAKFKP